MHILLLRSKSGNTACLCFSILHADLVRKATQRLQTRILNKTLLRIKD